MTRDQSVNVTGHGNRAAAHNTGGQPRKPLIGEIVHYRHAVHSCLAAVVTSPPHADGTADLYRFPAERGGQQLSSGHLPAVPRAERETMCWHRPAHGCT